MENWWLPMSADGIWYASDGAKDITSIISEEGNSFARINSYAFTAGGFSQLVKAHAGQVVTFSGDSRGFDSQQNIHLFLLPRNASGENFEVSSYSLVNPGNEWTNSTVAATMPPGTVSCQVMFFSRATGLVDFDNAVVNVTDPAADRDGDLVPDWEDEYADNPAQAFNDYYPAKERPGTLAFEDSWPQQEDYDYNDLVIDYQLRRVCNSNNKIVEIDFISQVRAIGTTTDNGFGFQLYLPTELIAGVESDFKDTNEEVNLSENGTEMGQKWATFILFTHGSKTFPKTQVGSPTINSTMGYYFIIPLEYKFRIYLKEPIDAGQVGNDKINPFLFKTGERSREVHLPGFPPTDLINHTLIGTNDDATSGESGILYQTKKGAPWALNLPIQWDYPRENTDILNAHLKFRDWITSGGTQYQDWYLDKDGYRNWDRIYRW
jgi:LruC domain-containing protein